MFNFGGSKNISEGKNKASEKEENNLGKALRNQIVINIKNNFEFSYRQKMLLIKLLNMCLEVILKKYFFA